MKSILKLAILLAIAACQNQNQQKPPATEQKNTEPHRPNYHFTPPEKWMNDPNGMVFYEGEYHLFYQYFPDSTVWGPMHWGHAVSTDLVRWQHLPVALTPDSLGLIFSGSAVVDWKNTSGFGLDGKPPLVAIFTQHLMAGEKAGRHDFQYQSIAWSNDRGRTWTKYAGNPVVPNTQKIHDFRDPKVSWDSIGGQWLMVFAAGDHVKFFGSPDLKKWTQLSEFGKNHGAHGGVWECPDFFPMRDEATGERRWVLLSSINPGSPNGGSGTQYFVGSWDGKNFQLDPDFEKNIAAGKSIWLDWGRDNYAGVTWSDTPHPERERFFIGWMSNWDYAQVVPTDRWRSAMTLPRVLNLKKTEAGWRIFSRPTEALGKLRGGHYFLKNQKLAAGEFAISEKCAFPTTSSEVVLEFGKPEMLTKESCEELGIVLSNSKGEQYKIGFDVARNQFFSDRTQAGKQDFSKKFAGARHVAPRISTSPVVKMHLFFDRASCELFADNGATCLTDVFFPNEDFTSMKIFVDGGAEGFWLESVQVWQLKN